MTVLIVDDNQDLVEALAGVLEKAPPLHDQERIEVRTASTGASALEIARSVGFDVAIVDVKLPDTSGVDLIEPLRNACPGSEIVLITGFASMDAAINALRANAFALILKNFRPEELIATVEQALTKVRLQRERTELERRYRALVDLTDVLVVGLDYGGKVMLFNQKAAQTSGIGAEEALGRDFLASWIPESERQKMHDAIIASSASDRPREVETGFLAREQGVARGLPMRIRWHLSVSREDVPLLYAIGIDVTERRALEKRAADAEALSAMGTLALNLAHEIRNPLNAAVLQLHLLRRDIEKITIPDQTRSAMNKRVEVVGDEIARLSRLLTEFLELARPRDVAREPVHMGELANFVLDLERDTAEARGVSIVRDIQSDACTAIGDSAKLKQVLINIVVNALEAMKDGGTLTVSVRGDGKHVHVEIADTGPGIDATVLPSVFDPFFTTKEAGTGLGLSIVRKIVDQHAGDIRIVSRPGEGTKVQIWIPMGR